MRADLVAVVAAAETRSASAPGREALISAGAGRPGVRSEAAIGGTDGMRKKRSFADGAAKESNRP